MEGLHRAPGIRATAVFPLQAAAGCTMLAATDARAEGNVIMAGVMMALLPSLVVLLLLRRTFAQSISLGQKK
ncbi:MAG: hypothetical protein QN122_13950 [Armatimonadota bacterium]|nr:hypothetical protein [Armatimonadota bacterium]MDR7529123.1 hypothetical protein [Armatimonadota bacterium]